MKTDIYFFIISLSFLLTMKNVSDRICKENKTHILLSVTFFFSKIAPFMRQCGKILYSHTGHS